MFIFLLSCLASNSSSAAVIEVACDEQALIGAIVTAEANAEADTLDLATDCRYQFSQPSFLGTINLPNGGNRALGATALPVINSEIAINGNNAIIERLNDAPRFRHIVVDTNGDLTLNRLTLTNGLAENGTAGVRPNFLIGADFFAQGMPGGAIAVNGSLTLQQCTFSHNQAGNGVVDPINSFLVSGGSGGAIYVSTSSSEFMVTETTFFNNSTGHGASDASGVGSSGSGGALSLRGESTVIKNSLFDSNNALPINAPSGARAGLASAITLFSDSFISENSTYTNNGNRVPGSLFFANSLAQTTNHRFIHNTFLAPAGEFLSIQLNQSTSEFNASIFSSDRGVVVFCRENNDVFGHYNLIDSPNDFTSDACNFENGVDNNHLDPTPNDNLAPLANNGGPTLSHALLDNSLALDVIPVGTFGILTDQRSMFRMQDADGFEPFSIGSDIGAIERELVTDLDGSTASGTMVPIQTQKMEQWYRFEAQAGDEITFTAEFSHAIGDLDLYFFKEQNLSQLINSSVSTTDDETINVTIETTGTYRFLVSGFFGGSTNFFDFNFLNKTAEFEDPLCFPIVGVRGIAVICL